MKQKKERGLLQRTMAYQPYRRIECQYLFNVIRYTAGVITQFTEMMDNHSYCCKEEHGEEYGEVNRQIRKVWAELSILQTKVQMAEMTNTRAPRLTRRRLRTLQELPTFNYMGSPQVGSTVQRQPMPVQNPITQARITQELRRQHACHCQECTQQRNTNQNANAQSTKQI